MRVWEGAMSACLGLVAMGASALWTASALGLIAPAGALPAAAGAGCFLLTFLVAGASLRREGARRVADARALEEAGARERENCQRIRALEDALEAAQRVAAESLESRSRFVACVSHELRTPLNGMLGMVGLLLKTPLSPLQRRHALLARSSARSLAGVLDQVLDLSRIEAGTVVLEVVDFDLHAVLEDLADSVVASAVVKELEFVVGVAPGTWPSWRGDRVHLCRVLTILVEQALRWGHVCLDVSPAVDLADGMRFTVSGACNSSNPAQPEEPPLALAVARPLVERMGGFLEVGDEASTGAGFQLEVPLVRQLPGGADEGLPGRRVLLAEKHEPTLVRLERSLGAWGCHCATVGTRCEAVALLSRARERGEPFDAVLLAASLMEQPASDLEGGGTLCGVPAIVLAYPGDQDGGACAVVHKPVLLPRLRRALEAALLGRQPGVETGGVQSSPVPGIRAEPGGAFDAKDLVARLMGNRALAARLLVAFQEELPQKVAALQAAVAAWNAQEVKMQAHALKGACATMAAVRLRDLMVEMLQAVELGSAAAAQGLLGRVPEEVEAFRGSVSGSGLV